MDKERKREFKAFSRMAQASAIGRGTVLTMAAEVEDLLTSIIAWCFSPICEELDGEVDSLLSETAIALKSIILRRIDFSEKIALLEQCVQFRNEGIYKSNRKLIKQVKKDLDKVREFRNSLAHLPMDTSKEYVQQFSGQLTSDSDSFQVLEYKKGKVHKRNISFDVLKQELQRARVTLNKLLQLWSLLKNRPDEAGQHELLSTVSADETSSLLKRMGYK